jgi:hypothetical protein
MFRSRRRDVVFPQAEHARLAATVALAWGNERFARPALPFERFVRGVALHDRGYGQADADAIGEVAPERWLEIQLAGFAPRGEDAVVDLVVALHVARLVSGSCDGRERAALEGMRSALPALHAAAGVAEDAASDADRITDLCDRISFEVCLEEAGEGCVGIAPAPGAEPVAVSYRVDGRGGVTLAPWPLAVPRLGDVVVGYRGERYPRALEPVVAMVHVSPE